MSFLTREQRYDLLCSIKRCTATGKGRTHMHRELTEEEEAFVVEFATEKFNEMMEDPEIIAVMKRLKDL